MYVKESTGENHGTHLLPIRQKKVNNDDTISITMIKKIENNEVSELTLTRNASLLNLFIYATMLNIKHDCTL